MYGYCFYDKEMLSSNYNKLVGLFSRPRFMSTHSHQQFDPSNLVDERTLNQDTASALYAENVRQKRSDMGPIMTARRLPRWKGNLKYLAGIAVITSGIYYYCVWKVGQDDFSDVDERGNIRERI